MPNTYSFLGVTVSGSFQYLVQVRDNTYYDGLGNELFSIIGSVSVGPQGRVGSTGLQGETGPQGFSGETGLQGETGPQGWQGRYGPTGAGGALGHWGSFWDTTIQTNPTASYDNSMSFNSYDSTSNGIKMVDGRKVTFDFSGVYNIQFSAQFEHTGNGNVVVDIWLSKNNQNVEDTNTQLSLNKSPGDISRSVPSWNFMLPINAGDYLELKWSAPQTDVRILALGTQSSPDRPSVPSIILTVQQVMYTQVGPTGSQGVTGFQGFTGPQGLQGFTGPQGSQGDTGPQGFTGPQGLQGSTGLQGFTGPQGPAGGGTGTQGDTGPQGQTGPQGPAGGGTGTQGDTGPQGIQGPTGAVLSSRNDPFTSVLSVNIFHGFGSYPPVDIIDDLGYVIIPTTIVHNSINDYTVTFATVSSGTVITGGGGFSGPKGETGNQGWQGYTGPQGEVGPQGVTGSSLIYVGLWNSGNDYYPNEYVDYSGILYLNYSFQSTGALSPEQVPGAWLQLTVVGSTGLQGLTGPQGFQGFTGPQGPVGGGTGLQGSTGFQGETGPQGFQGETGPQGFQGVTGFQGETGPQGYQGLQGNAGQSSHYFGYYATQSLSGNPGPTFLLWNNSTQIGATQINISHLDATNTDVDVFLSQIKVDDTLIIQDQVDSDNYQKFTVNDQITLITNSYSIVPVLFATSSGIGTTNFNSGQHLALFIFSSGIVGPQGQTGPQGFTGNQGETGPQGNQGFTGPQGETGPQGNQGFQGFTGSQGFQGLTGAQGFTGPQGFTGNQGETGPQGNQGFQGFTGPQGNTGLQGYQGITGVQGETGPQGNQGFTGPQGETGPQGNQGFQGFTGPQGFQGLTGAQGFTGPQGLQGYTGPQGQPGTSTSYFRYRANIGSTTNYPGDGYILWTNASQISATAIHVSHLTDDTIDIDVILSTLYVGQVLILQDADVSGNFQKWQISSTPSNVNPNTSTSYWNYGVTSITFSGTYNFTNNQQIVLQVLSQGSNGAQGFQGLTGPQGWQGNTGPQGNTGAQGFQGLTGPQGWQGSQGPGNFTISGTAPSGPTSGDRWYDLSTGFEYIYIFDGDSSQWVTPFPAGSQGPQGPTATGGGGGTSTTGFQGTTGPQGFTGLQGTTGPQGFTGQQGFQGLTGAQGFTGQQGFQGLTGPQGFQGFTGPQGAAGSISALPVNQIAFGTGTGITSSNLLTFTSSTRRFTVGSNSILGSTVDSSIISGQSNNIFSSDCAAILGGWRSYICNSNFSNIIGGQGNDIFNSSCFGSISGGYYNFIGTASCNSSIVGGFCNTLTNNSCNSSIIGGKINLIRANSRNSTIIGGECGTLSDSCNSSIIGGFSNNITVLSVKSSVISGECNLMINARNSIIAAGFKNCIKNTYCGSIIGGFCNYLQDSYGLDSIIGGFCNQLGTNTYNNTIIGGFCGDMFKGASQSVILGGKFNCLNYSASEDTIVGGNRNILTNNTRNSSILGGQCNKIKEQDTGSTIIGGFCNIISGCRPDPNNPTNYCSTYNSILGGQCNLISSSNVFGIEYGGILCNSKNNSIIGGYKNCIGFSSTDASYKYGIENSVIVGGSNLILGKNECNLVYVPELKLNTAVQDDNLTRILVWDYSATKKVKWRDVSSISGGGTSYIYDNTLFVHPDGNNATAIVGNFNLPFATIQGAHSYVVSNGITNPVIEIWPKNSSKGPSPLGIPSTTYDYFITQNMLIQSDIKFHLKSGVRIKYQQASSENKALFTVSGSELVVTSEDSTATIEVLSINGSVNNYLVDVSNNGGSYGKAIFENVTLYTISLQESDNPFISPRSSFGACVRQGAYLIMKNVLFYNHYHEDIGGNSTAGNVFMYDECTFEAWNCKFYNRIERDREGAHIWTSTTVDYQDGFAVIRLHDSSFVQRYSSGIRNSGLTYVVYGASGNPFVILGNNTFFANDSEEKYPSKATQIGTKVLQCSTNGWVQYVSRSIHNYLTVYGGSWTEVIGKAESVSDLGTALYGFLESSENALFEPFDTINLI